MSLQEPWIIGLLACHLLLLVLVLVFRKSWNLNLVIMVSAGELLPLCAFSRPPSMHSNNPTLTYYDALRALVTCAALAGA